MNSKSLPLKSLIRLNTIISFISSSIIALFLLGIDFPVGSVFQRFIQLFFFTSWLTFFNLKLFVLVFRENTLVKNYFYVISYIGAICAWFIVKNLYSLVTGEIWEGDGIHSEKAYVLAILSTLCFNTIILVIQNLIIVQYNQAKYEMENLELKAYLSDAENLLLRQQIHPHFLFNSLNIIKALYKTNISQGEEYLIYLANFLRISISNQETQTTLIKNELEFCLYYLKMQKIRFGNAVEYTTDIPENTLNRKYLPYFSLQPLVENILKHNNLTESNPIIVSIYQESDYIIVRNNLQERSHKEKSSKSGLHNLSERYRLLGEANLEVIADSHFFIVKLKILNQ